MAFSRDVTENVAYGLVALGIYLFGSRPLHWLCAAAAFALAGLARETTLVFPILYAAHLFLGLSGKHRVSPIATAGNDFEKNRVLHALIFLLLAVGPTLLWQLFLHQWLGQWGIGAGCSLVSFPFLGLRQLRRQAAVDSEVLKVLLLVILPGTLCFAVGVWSCLTSSPARRQVEVWLLVLNSLLFVLLLHPLSLVDVFSTSRIALPVVLASICSLAFIKPRAWFYSCTGLWLAPTLVFVLYFRL
jgi:hypothetical protein